MGSISFNGQKAEVADGSAIKDAAEKLGVPFSCKEGVCGSCLVHVTSGEENLEPMNEAEQDYGLKPGEGKRLTCQCKLKSGDITLESGY